MPRQEYLGTKTLDISARSEYVHLSTSIKWQRVLAILVASAKYHFQTSALSLCVNISTLAARIGTYLDRYSCQTCSCVTWGVNPTNRRQVHPISKMQ